MRFVLRLSAILISLLLSVYVNAAADVQKAQGANEKLVACSVDEHKGDRYLFVQSAASGTIKKIVKKSDNTTQELYEITLYNVPPVVTCFSERPVRKAKSASIQTLLNLWKVKGDDNFKNNPPNADVNAFEDKDGSIENAKKISFVAELSNPVYNPTKHTLTYTMKLVPGSPQGIPNAIKLKFITLFIDDVCLS